MAERVGVAIVVWRRASTGIEFLLLHRTAADEVGPWSWTFPSGGCNPGESTADCAARELAEETGLQCRIEAVPVPSRYPLFRAEVTADAAVRLLDGEHDRFQWVLLDRAVQLLEPTPVADSLLAAAEGIH